MLSWGAATDNVAVAGYRIYRDGVAVAETSATSYTDQELILGRTYTYRVQAYDAAQNRSAQSRAITVTIKVVRKRSRINYKNIVPIKETF
jgi:chitinase